MLKDNELIGAIRIYRQEVQPFTDKQIELVRNFAAQAVIAIENTRLLGELRQRTGDLTEALEQQTTTAEILGVISKSLSDTQPVFDAIVQSGVRLFSGAAVSIALVEDGMVKAAAVAERDPVRAELWRQRFPFPLTREYMHSVAILDRKMLDIPNVEDAPAEMAVGRKNFLGSGYRAATFVPLMRGETAIGALSVVRVTTGPLSEKQLAALKTYASQAVIAIENTRLLNELRQSLEQQTATAEVLGVISSSPGEIAPVFETVLANATRLCEANFGVLQLCEDGGFRMVAMHNPPPAYAESRRRQPVIHPGPLTPPARVAATKQLLHVTDLTQEEAYKVRDPSSVRFVETAGVRTLLVVPMLKESELIGEISVYRQEVRPFTDRQIALLQNFAAQAVIAIENTRLLNELRQSLEQQTATSNVLRVISASPGALEPVFAAMLENATRICDAKFGIMTLYEGGPFRAVALHNAPPEFGEARRREPLFSPAPNNPLARVAATKETLQIPDLRLDESYLSGEQATVIIAERGGARTLIDIPMLKDGELVGVFGIYRQEVRPFSDKQIELLQNFAAQAVIAIENTRLLNELRQRTDDLSESLEQQTATSEVLKIISSSPGALEPVFDAILANATRICEAKFGNLTLYEGGVFRRVALHNAPAAWAADLQREPRRSRQDAPVLYRLVDTKEVVHVADITMESSNETLGKLTGARTLLLVPMLKEGELVGSIGIYRQEVRPFSEKQIALLRNFAAQAVIAIENARLLNELRQRTDDLTESLEQQTATSEVLEVISSSPGELEPVFQSMLENATRICGAKFGNLLLYEADAFRLTAVYGAPPAWAEEYRRNPIFRPSPDVPLGRVAATKQVVHVADVAREPGYAAGDPAIVPLVDIAGARSLLVVPMLKENELVGAFGIFRQEVRPFSPQTS